MSEHYMCVPALSLKPNDRIVEFTHTYVSKGHQKTIHMTMVNLTVHKTQWAEFPFGPLNCIQADVTHSNGEEEYLHLRARSKVWIMRKE
jgi:hypothetical protein